jgi:hypothetical protein
VNASLALGLAALLPLMIGPSLASIASGSDMMFVTICDDAGDRVIAVPLSGDDTPEKGPCESKACHGAPCRKKSGVVTI